MNVPGIPLPPGYRIEANATFAYLFRPDGAIVIAAQDAWTREFLLQFEHEYRPLKFDDVDVCENADHNT